MIARFWHGRTRREDAKVYAEYMYATGVAALRKTPGNLAALLLQRLHDDHCEHIVFSLWESMEAVRAFAGDRPELAVYFPEDERYLLEMERLVEHFDVVACETDEDLAAGSSGSVAGE